MLYNIKTGYAGMRQTPMSEIVILVSSLRTLVEQGVPFVFTDRHAYLLAADESFSSDLADLNRIDWKILQARDFRRDPNDPGKFERYQAEALVHRQMPVTTLLGIVCHGPTQEARLLRLEQDAGAELTLAVRPSWFF